MNLNNFLPGYLIVNFMKGIPKPVGCAIAVSFLTLALAMSTTQPGLASLFGSTQDPTFGPGNPRFDAASELLLPDGSFPQIDPDNPTKEVILPQETKEYTNVYFKCTEDLTTEMEQPCNRIMLYLVGECEDNDM
jgi:hypothetical protein